MVRQAGSESKILVLVIIFYIRPPISVSLFLMQYLMLDGQTLFHKGDFHRVRCLKDDF